MNIDISKLKEIKSELELLNDDDDALFINDGDETKYAIINIDFYNEMEEIYSFINYVNEHQASLKENTEPIELSYEEYETLKEQILDAIEKNLAPKPEKMN